MTVPLVCLLGRHGSGKSTIGAALADYGYTHLSVGALRRIAQANQFPTDVPVALVSAMRRERAGAPLSAGTARRLVDHACSVNAMVLDGFPSSPEHLALLPSNTVFCVLWVPALAREVRLHERGAKSKRQWTPGLSSARELALPELIRHVKSEHRCLLVRNTESVAQVALSLVQNIALTTVA